MFLKCLSFITLILNFNLVPHLISVIVSTFFFVFSQGVGMISDQSVGDWLERAGLPQYESKLLLNGFDDLRFMVRETHTYSFIF